MARNAKVSQGLRVSFLVVVAVASVMGIVWMTGMNSKSRKAGEFC